MKRRIVVLVFAVALVAQSAQAMLVSGDGERERLQWLDLTTPTPWFVVTLTFVGLLSLVIISRCARAKGVPLYWPSSVIPALLLVLVFGFFLLVPCKFAAMYGDFGCPPSRFWWMWFPYTMGSRWYGAMLVYTLWTLTHPILLRPRTPPSRVRRVLLFLPQVGILLLLVAWFAVVSFLPLFTI